MDCSFEEYIESVYSQLECNADDEYKKLNTVYLYSNSDIDNNKKYFRYCMDQCLSPYKSLLFFRDYLDGEWDISDKSYKMVYDKNGTIK